MAYSIVNNNATINITGSIGINRVIVKKNVTDVTAEDNTVTVLWLKKDKEVETKLVYTEVTSPVFASAKDLQDYIAAILGDISSGVISFSGGSTGLTPSVATQGNIVLGGVLNKPSGGTGVDISTTALTLGTASANNGSIVFQNATNANTITVTSGVTSASYSLTLPTAQASGVQVLTNDGTGVLSWSSAASGITIGTTTITSGTNTRILYDNAGVVGEYTITGTGTVVAMQTAPAFLTSISTPSIITAAGALGITPAAGSGVNITLSTTGDFAVNTNQLYVDTSTGFTGIGTTTPNTKLEVSQAAAAAAADFDNKQLRLTQGITTADFVYSKVAIYDSTTYAADMGIYFPTAGTGGYKLIFSVNDDTVGNPSKVLTIQGNGRVGFQTVTPSTDVEINHNFNGETSCYILNANTGAGASEGVLCGEVVSGGKYAFLSYYNNSFTTNGALMANAGVTGAYNTGGFNVVAGSASGILRAYTGGFASGNLRWNTNAAGGTFFGGSTSATALVHIAAGTATASTAPLKLTSGTNLATAENGAIEYNGADFFGTKSGATRGTFLVSTAVTTEVIVSDTTLTVTHAGVTYKILCRA